MKDELLLRLESFEIDEPGVAFPFSARLARENGWTRGFARRVVAEYKRFVWLALRAGHPVTPSEEVDEAWHLHLCYTRSYWDGMCREILGRPLHHGPTAGGAAEEAKFADWYARTLDSYRAHFGEEPPADIWPPAAVRFRPVTARKVDAATHWVLPKRAVKRGLLAAAALAVPMLLAGCTNLLAAADWSGLICVFIPMFMILAVVLVARKSKQRGAGRYGGGGATGFGASSCGTSGGTSSDDSGSGCSSSGCGSSGCGGGGGCGGS